MTVKIYGIPNCDTMKKAFEFMKTNNVAYDFHDYKTSGIEAAKLKSWGRFAPHRDARPLLQGRAPAARTPPGQPAGFLLYCYPTFIGNCSVTVGARHRGARKQFRFVSVHFAGIFPRTARYTCRTKRLCQ